MTQMSASAVGVEHGSDDPVAGVFQAVVTRPSSAGAASRVCRGSTRTVYPMAPDRVSGKRASYRKPSALALPSVKSGVEEQRNSH